MVGLKTRTLHLKEKKVCGNLNPQAKIRTLVFIQNNQNNSMLRNSPKVLVRLDILKRKKGKGFFWGGGLLYF